MASLYGGNYFSPLRPAVFATLYWSLTSKTSPQFFTQNANLNTKREISEVYRGKTRAEARARLRRETQHTNNEGGNKGQE